jgi:hypothetical protein
MDELVYKRNPFLAMVPKFEAFGASTMKFPLLYGNPQSVSASFATAQTAAAAAASSKWAGFEVLRATKHGVAVISGDAIASTRDDKAAFVRALKSEVDGMLNAMTTRIAGEVFGAGWGDLGTIGSSSTTTLTLANINDIVKVEVGQKHVFSSSRNAATLRDTAQALTVSAVNRSTGVITYTENVSEIASVANGDYIFCEGDRQNSASPSALCILGVEAWIPTSAPDSTAFCGQNRALDVVRLAGNRQDSTGQPLEEALLDADAAVFREGGELSHFLLSPKNFAELAKAMGTRVRYQTQQAGKIGFSSILVAGQGGDIAVVADRSVPSGRIYGVTLDSWELCSDKKLVRINDDDGLTMLRQSSADGVEVRGVSRAQLICTAPGHQIVVSI